MAAREGLAHGGELHAVIPCLGYEAAFEDAREAQLFIELLGQAGRVTRLDFDAPSEQAYWAAGQFVVAHSDLLLAVWDGEASRGLGGTADVVRHAHEHGVPVSVVWPPGITR